MLCADVRGLNPIECHGKDVGTDNFEEEGDPNGDVAQSARSIDRLEETLRKCGSVALRREVDMGPKVAEVSKDLYFDTNFFPSFTRQDLSRFRAGGVAQRCGGALLNLPFAIVGPGCRLEGPVVDWRSWHLPAGSVVMAH